MGLRKNENESKAGKMTIEKQRDETKRSMEEPMREVLKEEIEDLSMGLEEYENLVAELRFPEAEQSAAFMAVVHSEDEIEKKENESSA
ncbi:hypothetical protein AMTR_s00003p00225080 [Amborella trichopoda]|uniref:Uncharacterized protein n=1 Tax=Amborella trichopoda TaxID=13333 RepID=W1P5W4_AMBTC|nr:hypothetical protein AMTR_s00003p00225080 [Amborella trichopoda]